jgi:hypothetical protein
LGKSLKWIALKTGRLSPLVHLPMAIWIRWKKRSNRSLFLFFLTNAINPKLQSSNYHHHQRFRRCRWEPSPYSLSSFRLASVEVLEVLEAKCEFEKAESWGDNWEHQFWRCLLTGAKQLRSSTCHAALRLARVSIVPQYAMLQVNFCHLARHLNILPQVKIIRSALINSILTIECTGHWPSYYHVGSLCWWHHLLLAEPGELDIVSPLDALETDIHVVSWKQILWE